MAKALKEHRVILIMDKEESEVLHSVLQHITGTASGPRKHIDRIKLALNQADVRYAPFEESE